ncbi:MAG TPA: lysine--tRNA ligase [candidate division CPR3 bacterium]|uniref:Lysine--tRNA ligase n=1 Tax=candidate division CPR3 bacterium TaxID=2268181 RepID=A0A7C1T2B8_UNCC3|nr:lysine--tRNA ligase [candidate division CPR3 bacterium]
MASISDIKKARLSKLKRIESAGKKAYPVTSQRTHLIDGLLSDFTKLSKGKKEVTIAGRMRSFREHGGSTFFDVQDATASIQAYLKRDGVGEKAYAFFLDNFDIGDIVQIRGTLFKTKKGEKTVEVADYKILAKSLLPLPEKWHGLQDVEERYRKRYLDLIFNKDVREKFQTRTKIIQSLRRFLEKEGFMEVDTPILQSLYGGADATPFKTHMKAFDANVYLRIAPELYLKRLIVGGFEKVYEIGRVFRNEGVDKSHNPDFTMLEFYWAYADYKDMMKFTEEMFSTLLKDVFGKTTIEYDGKKLDFKTPWKRVEYSKLIKQYAKVDIEELNRTALIKKAKELDVPVEPSYSKAKVADAIMKKYCFPKLWEPTFIIHYPADSIPLAKKLDEDDSKLGAFQLVAAGWELIKAYSELNDPIEQRRVFKDQEKLYKKGDQEAQRMDENFIEALEYGMPPTAGFGMGIDRLTTLLTDSHSLRESILFPFMRQKK